jgi:hypothetical protein
LAKVEQRDYELIRPIVLFGTSASERAKDTAAAPERTRSLSGSCPNSARLAVRLAIGATPLEGLWPGDVDDLDRRCGSIGLGSS